MSITKRLAELDEAPDELPAEAFSDADTREVADDWLATASPAEQIAAMRQWFLARYCDPQYETPYNSEEGGYLYVHGGPYDPGDVLQDRFGDTVDFDTIWSLVEDLYAEIGEEWAPTSLTAEHDWLDIFIDTGDGPLTRLEVRLQELRTLVALDGPPESRILLRQLVYGAVITALETYLWELAAFWWENDPTAFDRVLAHQPAHVRRLEALGGDTPLNREALRREIFRSKVWHRWEKNSPFLSHVFNVPLPPHASLEEPTRIRHDIAHRGGKDLDHNPVNISAEDVEVLMGHVLEFSRALQASIDARAIDES